jgi:hypothetical protein
MSTFVVTCSEVLVHIYSYRLVCEYLFTSIPYFFFISLLHICSIQLFINGVNGITKLAMT